MKLALIVAQEILAAEQEKVQAFELSSMPGLFVALFSGYFAGRLHGFISRNKKEQDERQAQIGIILQTSDQEFIKAVTEYRKAIKAKVNRKIAWSRFERRVQAISLDTAFELGYNKREADSVSELILQDISKKETQDKIEYWVKKFGLDKYL